MPQPTFSVSRCGPPPGQSPLCPSGARQGPCAATGGSRSLKAVVTSISCHVAIQGQCQALWPLHWLCRHVDVRQQANRPVVYLDAAVAPVSFRMFPSEATATPVGALNCPWPSPWEPDLKRNSQLALDTFTEWLWKFITTISFLFVATKLGPTISGPMASKIADEPVIGLEGQEEALSRCQPHDMSVQVYGHSLGAHEVTCSFLGLELALREKDADQWLSLSATIISPLVSTATPMEHRSCPGECPWAPKRNLNWPSLEKTWIR